MKSVLVLLFLVMPSMSASAAEYAATLQWSQRVNLSTPVSGVVGKVLVQSGDRVQKGQELLVLDDRPFKNAMRRASSQINKLKLMRDEAEREYERNQELYERTVISKHDLEIAQIEFSVAEADYTKARSDLAEAKLGLEYSKLYAPFDGVILAVMVSVGEAIINTQQAKPLVAIASDRPMQARALLPASEIVKLNLGDKVDVAVGEKNFDASIDRLGLEPLSEAEVSGYELVVSFQPGDSIMRAGLPVMINTDR